MRCIPVLDIGGTHVTAARVDPRHHRVVIGTRTRRALHSCARGDQVLDDLASATATLGDLTGEVLGIAIPGPFDYAAGIGHFDGVGKFDGLRGIDVGAALIARLSMPPARMVFVHDAEAFAQGEWLAGAARGLARVAAVTLGTGVGSAFLRAGVATADPTVPPQGRLDLLTIDGRPLEDTISRRALIAAYQRLMGAPIAVDVADIARRAHTGEPAARQVFEHAFSTLGETLAPWLIRFDAQVLVVGGEIGRAFDLLAPPLLAGIHTVQPGLDRRLCLVPSGSADSTEIGAAWRTR